MIKIELIEKYKTSRGNSQTFYDNLTHETLYFTSEESYAKWKNELTFEVPELHGEPEGEGFYLIKKILQTDLPNASAIKNVVGFRTGVY